MPRDISLLDRIQIATPCTASWSAMKGDDRTRFCEQCSLHVYNISEMTRAEAEKLIIETEGRLCTRLYRRRDGTVITEDCPIALAAARRHLTSGIIWLAGAVTACMSVLCLASGDGTYGMTLRDMEPFDRLYYWLRPPMVTQGVCANGPSNLSYSARSQLLEVDQDLETNESRDGVYDKSDESEESEESDSEE